MGLSGILIVTEQLVLQPGNARGRETGDYCMVCARVRDPVICWELSKANVLLFTAKILSSMPFTLQL
jgi:hypothetical protein